MTQSPRTASASNRKSVVWGHATTAERYAALQSVFEYCCQNGADATYILTGECGPKQRRSDHVQQVDVDTSSAGAARRFFAHWRPTIGFCCGGGIPASFLEPARNIPTQMVLVDTPPAEFAPRRKLFRFRDDTKVFQNSFHAFLARDQVARQKLLSWGASRGRVVVRSPLYPVLQVKDCADEDVADIAACVAGRPLWLAVFANSEEYSAIIAAHRHALRLSHRLLLAVIVDDRDSVPTLQAQLSEAGVRSVEWEFGDPLEENTQALIVSEAELLPLWYRLAPISFLGQSLSPQAGGISPMEAAGLGTAILYGPNIRDHLEIYSALARAGAARIVKDGETLGNAVVQLFAPDKTAAMALAGWEVVTEGALMADHIAQMVQVALANERERHART